MATEAAINVGTPEASRTEATPLRELRARGQKWGLLEVFVLTVYLSSALLFIPGAQQLRIVIRALPYLFSLALLVRSWVEGRGLRRTWPGQIVLLVALAILAFSMFHPASNPWGGLAQVVLQFSIAAPAWWVTTEPVSEQRLDRILKLIFVASAASALTGLLQIFFPDQFMPAEFSRQALLMNKELVSSLSYVAADGSVIVRPPGLTDLPGGACAACANTALLGVLLGFQQRAQILRRVLCLAVAGAALVTLYLTQVRSMFLMTAVGYIAMCALLMRQRRYAQSGLLMGVGFVLLAVAFSLAFSIGGDTVYNRYHSLVEDDFAKTLYASRGIFLEHTFTQLIYDFPFGAGVGRWGMMNFYFARYDADPSPGIWVEIQPTGWLVDGGIPLLVAYTLAIAVAMWQLFRLTNPDLGGRLAYPAAVVFCMNIFMIGQSYAGPSFNSTSGMQFWLGTAMVFAAFRHRLMFKRERGAATADNGTPAS